MPVPRPPAASVTRAYVGALFAVVVWGASFIATKIALRQTDPFTVICLRFGIGIPVLFAAVARRGEFSWPGWRAVLQFVAIGTLGITVHQWLQVTGLITAQASTTAWIITATPLTIALVGWVALGERLGWHQWAGIGLGTTGVLLVVSRGDWRALAGGSFGSIGDLLVSLSTITWAVFSVSSRKALQRHAAAPMMLFVMAGGWFMSAVPWVLAGGLGRVGLLTPSGWTAVVFLGVLCSGLAYIYWYDALRILPTAKVGSLLYLEPLVTMGVAAALLGEPITISSIAGGVVILAGIRTATMR